MLIISELLQDSLFQAAIIGPIMGVLFAALFAGLNKSPSTDIPISIIQTREVYVTKTIEYKSQNSNQDGMGILLIAGFTFLFASWKYSIYINLIHYYIFVGIISALSFSLIIIIISYLKGQFTSREWWIYVASPFILLLSSIFLLNFAYSSFNPEITNLALENNVINFYSKALSEYGRNFMLAHLLGMLLLCLLILLSFFAMLHYLSLMNQRSNGFVGNVWFFFARKTIFFSGKKWLLLSFILLVLSFISLNPDALATWLTNKS